MELPQGMPVTSWAGHKPNRAKLRLCIQEFPNADILQRQKIWRHKSFKNKFSKIQHDLFLRFMHPMKFFLENLPKVF